MSHINIHGRKGGRGWRPWLLIPKIICAAILLGGFVSAEVLIRTADLQTPDDWHALMDVVSRLFRFVIVPAVIGTLFFGILLFAQHPKVFWMQRWFKVKIVLLAVGLPVLHLSANHWLAYILSELENGSPEGPTGALGMFALHLEVAIAALLITIWLGRHKPRLGRKPIAASSSEET